MKFCCYRLPCRSIVILSILASILSIVLSKVKLALRSSFDVIQLFLDECSLCLELTDPFIEGC